MVHSGLLRSTLVFRPHFNDIDMVKISRNDQIHCHIIIKFSTSLSWKCIFEKTFVASISPQLQNLS